MLFKDIIGHEREINILKNAIRLDRVAHAFLFSGIDGIGKRETAMAFAKALNCEGGVSLFGAPDDVDACGECGSCRMIEDGRHQSVIMLCPADKDGDADPNGLIRVEPIRDVQNALRYRVERGRKVVIVDNADRMVPQAANAFLKTLEEPPSGSVIILVTSRPSEMLPTVLSRCQRINFRPLKAKEITRIIKGVDASLTDERASVAARLSGGSVVKAIEGIAEGADGSRAVVISRLVSLRAGDADEALRLAEELSKMDGLVEVLESLKLYFRDRAVCMEGLPGLAAGEAHAAPNGSSAGRSVERAISAFNAVESARRDVMPPRYANKHLAMEAMLLNIIGA